MHGIQSWVGNDIQAMVHWDFFKLLFMNLFVWGSLKYILFVIYETLKCPQYVTVVKI